MTRNYKKKWQTAVPDKTAALSKSLQTFLKWKERWLAVLDLKSFAVSGFQMTIEKPIPKWLLRPITTGANSAMNQSEFLAVTWNFLKAREKSREQLAISFSFASNWLKNWCKIFKPITKRSNRNGVNTFDRHLKTALSRVVYQASMVTHSAKYQTPVQTMPRMRLVIIMLITQARTVKAKIWSKKFFLDIA